MCGKKNYRLRRSQTRRVSPEGDKAGVRRVIRGGSWYGYGGWDCRSAYRGRNEPDDRDRNLGFRLLLGHFELRSGQGGGAAGSGATNDRADGNDADRRGAGDTAGRGSAGSGGLVEKIFKGLKNPFRKKK
ncbi:SUMF1/EgtB/PvdO family nonheme iron enzyme [Thiothrix caldifontis]|uniref:SUMF1/EgtB/PvdO family nonheme iron enzyme n=1 Tax=Thiothrix caldifontis TaxID=525918 RepID=UPI003CCBD71C